MHILDETSKIDQKLKKYNTKGLIVSIRKREELNLVKKYVPFIINF